MIPYSELLTSNVMDMRFMLPSCPMHANPHIFCAYSIRVLESQGEVDGAAYLKDVYARNLLKPCERSAGLLTTFPGGNVSSHDDLYGAAYLNPLFGGRAIDYLERTDGIYRETEPTIFRFLFLLPALKAWAGFTVGPLSQIQFAIHLIWHMIFSKPGETSDHLMIWLAIPAMKKYLISGFFITIWAYAWNKRGMTPKSVFSNQYLNECPWFGKFARESWLD